MYVSFSVSDSINFFFIWSNCERSSSDSSNIVKHYHRTRFAASTTTTTASSCFASACFEFPILLLELSFFSTCFFGLTALMADTSEGTCFGFTVARCSTGAGVKIVLPPTDKCSPACFIFFLPCLWVRCWRNWNGRQQKKFTKIAVSNCTLQFCI